MKKRRFFFYFFFRCVTAQPRRIERPGFRQRKNYEKLSIVSTSKFHNKIGWFGEISLRLIFSFIIPSSGAVLGRVDKGTASERILATCLYIK